MNKLTVTNLTQNDLVEISSAFQKIGWHKPLKLFEKYLHEQGRGLRAVFVAKSHETFCGYVTLKWQSDYLLFAEKNIPEIVDLNVLPIYQHQGFGTQLVQSCENSVREKMGTAVGLGVGLTSDYGQAQRLYFRLGYRPDGNGLFYKNKLMQYGDHTIVDDDLLIYLIKALDQSHEKRSALSTLQSLEKNAIDFGFEWPNYKMIIEQALDECREISEAIEMNENPERIQEEIGDLLHSIISLCDFQGFDVESTLEKVNTKFSKRMQAVKLLTKELGLSNLKNQSFDFLLDLWRKAKLMAD